MPLPDEFWLDPPPLHGWVDGGILHLDGPEETVTRMVRELREAVEQEGQNGVLKLQYPIKYICWEVIV